MEALLALSSGDDDSDNDDSDTESFTIIDAFIAVAASLSSDDDEFEEEEEEEEDEAEVEKPDTMMMVEKPPILGRWWRKRVTKPRTLRYQQPVLDISKGDGRAREEELRSSKKKASVATTSYEDQGISWEERTKRESMLKKPVEVEENRVDKNKGVKNVLSIDLNQVFKEEGMSSMDEYMKLEWLKRDQIQVFKNGDKNKASTSTVKNILAFDLNKDFKEESMSSRDDEYMEELLNTDLKVFKNGTKRVLSRSKREEEEEEEHKSATKKRKTGNIKKKKGPGLGSGSGCLCSRRDYPGLNPPPSLPAEVRILIENESGGAVEKEPVLVIQKKLTKTDLSNRHNRLAVPVLQVKRELLTEKEKEFLKKKKEKADKKKKRRENKTETIASRIIMPSLWRADITLCRWEMKKGDGKAGCELYVLIGAWNKLRENEKTIEFELEPNMVVQLWAYRVNGCLRFALVNLGKFEPGSSSRNASGNSTTNPPHDSRCEDGKEDQN